MNNHSLSTAVSFLFLLLSILGLVKTVDAQMPPDNNLFQWKFSNNFLGTDLPSCMDLPITVEPVNATNITHGIPPFYMIAWEVGGTPRTTLLGLNESSLSWTVDHPIGTSLMLNVVDSQGNGGGIPPSLYTVTTGQLTECIVNGNQTDFTVSANITGNVQTCQPWGLRIKGGTPPYNLSLAQPSSPIVTNVTILAPHDAFTFINRATPGFLLLAAISDVTGRYAFGTPTMMPMGSSDVDCVGLNSSPGNATALDQEQAAQESAAAKARRQRQAILAGVLTPLFVLLFGGAAFLVYRYRAKQNKMDREMKPEPLALPEPKALEENSYGTGTEANIGSGAAESPVHISPVSILSLSNPFLSEAERSNAHLDSLERRLAATSTRPNSGSSTGRGFAQFPTSSIRRPGKAEEAFVSNRPSQNVLRSVRSEAALARVNPSPMERSQSAQVLGNRFSPSSMPPTRRSASLNATAGQSVEGEREYIIQHKDGGRLVRELPPPYRERRSRPEPDVPQSP
jgi:hypothetical protein